MVQTCYQWGGLLSEPWSPWCRSAILGAVQRRGSQL